MQPGLEVRLRVTQRFIAVALLVTMSAPTLCAVALPWYFGSTNPNESAPSAIGTHTVAPGPHEVVVAVIDSGVLADHPSLAGNVLPGYDMVSGANNLRGRRSSNVAPDELNAQCGSRLVSGSFRTHGTEVASVIAGNGTYGMQGIHPKAKILPVRAFSACGMSIHDLGDAILWAAGFSVAGVPDNPHPARVINISISGGGFACNPQLQEVIDKVVSKDIFVVVAAGNNFNKPLAQPANCTRVISVGAVSADNRIEKYSALDPRTTIYSPGGGGHLDTNAPWGVNKIRVATFASDLMDAESAIVADKGVGTSFAAPIAAGYIALWLSFNPQKTPVQWHAELSEFVRDVAPLQSRCPGCKPLGLVAKGEGFVP